MAIQINGNGTITGVSVGGLPDGIVDTDMIAASAVTPAKSTITNGKVLQVQQTVIDSQVSIGTGTETEIFNVSITPAATSSKVLVCVNMAPCYTNGSSTELKAIIYRDSTAISGLARYFGSAASTEAIGCPSGMFLDSPNTTSAITYRMKTTRVNGSDGYVINHTNGEAKSSITVMEIAA